MERKLIFGDLLLSSTPEGYVVSQLFKSKKAHFRIAPHPLTTDEVRGLGIDPETGEPTDDVRFFLNLVHGEDYWCLLIRDKTGRAQDRSLGKISDETVLKIFYNKTQAGSPFADLNYDDIRSVRRCREEKEFRTRMLDHIDDTKAIRETLELMLVELRKMNEPKPKPARKPTTRRATKSAPKQGEGS